MKNPIRRRKNSRRRQKVRRHPQLFRRAQCSRSEAFTKSAPNTLFKKAPRTKGAAPTAKAFAPGEGAQNKRRRTHGKGLRGKPRRADYEARQIRDQHRRERAKDAALTGEPPRHRSNHRKRIEKPRRGAGERRNTAVSHRKNRQSRKACRHPKRHNRRTEFRSQKDARQRHRQRLHRHRHGPHRHRNVRRRRQNSKGNQSRQRLFKKLSFIRQQAVRMCRNHRHVFLRKKG